MNKVIGLVLLLVGMMLAVGAGANFRYYEAERDITVAIVADDNEFIDLTPLQPYVYLNNGKLTVEISADHPDYPEGRGTGLSPNTTYVFEEMFEVSNDLWENYVVDGNITLTDAYPICVSISVPLNSDITLFTGEYNGTSSTQIQFTVYHGQPVKIGMVFDNTGLDLDYHQVQMDISAEAGECET
ncbi:DUF1102 domain-containing protein [Thermococcus sp.]